MPMERNINKAARLKRQPWWTPYSPGADTVNKSGTSGWFGTWTKAARDAARADHEKISAPVDVAMLAGDYGFGGGMGQSYHPGGTGGLGDMQMSLPALNSQVLRHVAQLSMLQRMQEVMDDGEA